MNGKSRNISPTGRPTRDRPSLQPNTTRLEFVLVVGAIVILFGYFAVRLVGPRNSSPDSASPGSSAANPPQPTVVAAKRRVLNSVQSTRNPEPEPSTSFPPLTRPAVTPTPTPVEPTPPRAGVPTVAQDLVARLAQPNFFSGGVTMQKADELKRSFKQLAEQGAAALPAIREYLDRFQDIDFDSVGAGKLVGYPSLRLAMLDVLGKVGGSEAMELSLQTLQKTGDPQEIAALTKGLEKQLPPDQVRQVAVAAASDALTEALSGKWDGRSVTPLFEVLQKYGDQNVAGLLEQAAGRWNYYATLALAGLPDGAGIPALIHLAQDPAIRKSANGDFALRPLAQAAMQYPEARTALVEQVRLNQVPDGAWPTVAASLSGNYIQYGNQVFGSTVPPVVWTSDQVSQRIALIDQLLAVAYNSAGQQALQNARAAVLTHATPP